MRVVGGEWRGRRLVAPAGRATRPTSDRVREAVFSTLEAYVARGLLRATPGDARSEPAAPFAGFSVLDLFAGSGALGIEALSRGAARCAFVERGAPALRALRANLEAFGCAPPRARVVARDALRAAQADVGEGNAYTLVLVDAPYAASAAFERRFAGLAASIIAPGGVLVIEAARGHEVRLPLCELAVKTYGSTQVTYLGQQVTCPGT
jgi:16S rRNA (guanine966-N2)-methyltransferase